MTQMSNKTPHTVEEKCQNVKYPHFENPFKVCSDEWTHRSLINSFIHDIEIEIILKEDTIKDYQDEIKKELSKSCHSEIWIERIQEHIKRHQKDVAKLKNELSVLKMEGMEDREKLDRRWKIHLRDL